MTDNIKNNIKEEAENIETKAEKFATKAKAKAKETLNKENVEKIQAKGSDLLQKIKELIKDGNVKRITVKDKNEKTLLSIPVNIGIVAVIVAPYLGVIAAIAALASECSIYIERSTSA